MASVKELKEAMVGMNELVIFLMMRFKDGMGMDDISAIWAKFRDDEDFKAKMMAAYDGWQAIPGEIKDIDMMETFDLVKTQIDFVPKIMEAMRK